MISWSMGVWLVRMLLCSLIYPVENANICSWASRLVRIPSEVQLHTIVGLTLLQFINNSFDYH